MSEIVTFEEHELYSLIAFDDGKANAVSWRFLEQLEQALDKAEATPKALVIAGRPGVFSAGFDLSVMSQGPSAAMELVREGGGLVQRLLTYPTPVVLAVTGHALAMGSLLTLAADYRVGASGRFKIGLNEVSIGMNLPYFAVQLAEYRLAKSHVHRCASLATICCPEEAVIAGYLDETVNSDKVVARAKAVASELSELNFQAHHQTKLRLREGLVSGLSDAFEKDIAN